jgi:ketosteroid isomerase-like protein
MPEPRKVVELWYQFLGASDLEGFSGLHADDVVYNIAGRTEISGRWQGKEIMFGTIIPKVFAALDPFASPYRIHAAEGESVAGLMAGGGRTHDGQEYFQTYAHLFTVRDGKIVEVWEFFDTELAQARLFGKPVEVATPPDNTISIED